MNISQLKRIGGILLIMGYLGLMNMAVANNANLPIAEVSLAIFTEIEGREADIKDPVYLNDRINVQPGGIARLLLSNATEMVLYPGNHQLIPKINPQNKEHSLYLVSKNNGACTTCVDEKILAVFVTPTSQTKGSVADSRTSGSGTSGSVSSKNGSPGSGASGSNSSKSGSSRNGTSGDGGSKSGSSGDDNSVKGSTDPGPVKVTTDPDPGNGDKPGGEVKPGGDVVKLDKVIIIPSVNPKGHEFKESALDKLQIQSTVTASNPLINLRGWQAAPTTIAPTTLAPTTLAPTTIAPTTIAPTTIAPTTLAPTTIAPTTIAPTTLAPTTIAPTTIAPTTITPTTITPIHVVPTTIAPTTITPTTITPIHVVPTTIAPTTITPIHVVPTTIAPEIRSLQIHQ